MKKIVLLSLFLSLSFLTYSQKEKKGNVFSNTADEAKLFSAKQKMLSGDYLSALNTFREVEKNNQTDASVKYYVGVCYFNLGKIDNAKNSFIKAIEINVDVKPETHFYLGRTYQIEDEVDSAIIEFKLFKTLPLNDKELLEDAATYLSQSENAKLLMAHPVPVVITNLGEEINSKYDDKNPCITADGNRIVFTTRRPETTNDPTDVEGDGKYFENIYTTTLDSTGNFTKAVSIGNTINTKAHDAVTSISPDGKQIFIYFNDMNSPAKRGGSVFVSKVLNDKWKAPVSLGKPINSSYWEGGACISADGKRYFFSSERKGSYGGSDIWMVHKKNKSEWGEPVNLGPEINTVYDEAGMFLAPDGKTLFFCSNGPKSMGGYDVLKTVFENGKWSSPVNVGYPINSSGKEGQLTISADAKFAYVSSNRKGGFGENDIYKIDLKDYAILEPDGKKKTSNGLSILKGTIREGNEGYGIQDVEVIVKDEQNKEIGSSLTNENGEYFFTMHGGKYILNVKKKGYVEVSENIDLGISEAETIILEKGYLLKK
ncbi:carboxypeptidase regulatory-like domain-containing protein [Aurantibacillus circumpalustris]|uniref:carboxypeptidase regulatory-like domain-containing protein n=1 Tax=Aurantibacillus circumpalustris TaxID=3036359 RepID=UPI00295A7784|nr:carboxypeptidase regulatory-like domain-containing protein [Aurantibacillus circumpalustris]